MPTTTMSNEALHVFLIAKQHNTLHRNLTAPRANYCFLLRLLLHCRERHKRTSLKVQHVQSLTFGLNGDEYCPQKAQNEIENRNVLQSTSKPYSGRLCKQQMKRRPGFFEWFDAARV